MKCVMYTHFDKLVYEKGFREALRIAKSIGFSGIEIIDCAITPDGMMIPSIEVAKEYRRILAEEEMTVACYSVGITLFQTTIAVEGLKIHADYAATIGAPYLHHTLCMRSAIDDDAPSYDEVFFDVLPRAIEVADYCKTLGMTCIYEDQGHYFNGVENFGRIYRAIKEKCENVGVCCDFGNILFADCHVQPFIKAFLTEIKHVHFKDYHMTPVKDNRKGHWHTTRGGNYLIGVPTGEGAVDFESGLHLLKKAGYDGFFAFEQELSYPDPFISDTKQAMVYLDGLFEK